MKSWVRIALGFTPYSGQLKDGWRDTVVTAGFTELRVVEHKSNGFCALAI
jgi:hypothetical protein